MIWACPLCQGALYEADAGVRCAAGHRFDRARQGYVNLLPAHHRRSAAPGDDVGMLTKRQQFLTQGFYKPLVDVLQQMLSARLMASREITLLDSGCGEGFYLQQLIRCAVDLTGSDTQFHGYGIDISKEAAKLAAKQMPKGRIAVGSAYRLPVLSRSIDLLLRIFSPGSWEEVERVLGAEGEMWLVVPGPRHLFELKAFLYTTPNDHESPEVPDNFHCVSQRGLTYSMDLSSPAVIEQLLSMTPFAWRGNKEGRERLLSQPSLAVTADFSILVLKPQGA